jgi:hypothetical protein
MWVPVAIDEITGRPGNLTKLWWFFTTPHGHHPYRQAVSELGRLLDVYPVGQLPPPLQEDFSSFPPERWLAIAVFLAGTVGLALVSTRVRDRFGQALAAMLLVAVPITTVSISRIAGPMYPYLLVWVTTFPMILAIGWAELLVRLRPWARREVVPRLAYRGLAAALAITMAALVITRFVAFQQLKSPAEEQFDPSTRAAWSITERALASEPPQPVLVDAIEQDRTPLAAAVALQLMKRGWQVKVNSQWVFIFGDSMRASGSERIAVVLVDPQDVAETERRMPDLQQIGQTPDTYIFLRRHPTRR